MNKVLKIKSYLSYYIKGMVFAILLISAFSSCCVTGYCQLYDETQKVSETKN